MSGIRIGVNALYLIPGGVGGTEIYLRNLLRALAEIDPDNEYFVFTNRETGPELVPPAPRFHHEPQPVRGACRPARILYEQLALPAAIRRRQLDVLLSPGFTTPAHCVCPAVSVFHDLQHKRLPEHFRWFDRPFWNLFLWQAARTARSILAVSRATADDLVRYYPWTSGKALVIHHGVDSRFAEIAEQRRRAVPEPYLLCVSTLHPHKNIERLLRVFRQFRRQRPDLSLVMAGMRGFHTGPIESLITELELGDAVRLTGWVPREELYVLYAGAYAFVYPSTFEGFGLPVLEALAAGIPTACSSVPSLLEVAGGATVTFEPSNEDEMLSALYQITDEARRETLAEAGRKRASGYTWEKCARATLSALCDAAQSV